MSNRLIDLQHITKIFDGEKILDDLNLYIRKNEFLTLLGPSGCGKSTLALLLARARGGNVLRLSAPEAGLQQLRRQLTGVDILVLDELHRFS